MRFLSRLILLTIICSSWVAWAGHEPHAGMLRYPHVSDSHIVFIYAEQLWTVSKEGGQAVPLANPPGNLMNPRFSPDGKKVAYSANYDGSSSIYWISTDGGVPHRVTHYPSREALAGWTPDGENLLFTSVGLGDHPRTTQVFKVSSEGGLPESLPVPYGAHPTISSDGKWLAYTPYARDTRTWKRYRGGMASDIWLFNLKEKTSLKITDWEGTDSFPMWYQKQVFYLSDAGANHKLNIWVYDTQTKKHNQVTKFDQYDVKFPAIGPKDLVFQNGSQLFLLDLASGETQPVQISVPGDRVQLKKHMVDAGKQIRNGSISTTGKRGIFEARGDIWSLPAENGVSQNLTRSDSAHDRSPIWSPDKEWIAFFSDQAGSYDLYQMKADGSGSPERLTQLNARFLYNNIWSPDSRIITFWNRAGELYMFDREEKKTIKIDTDPAVARRSGNFSHDSNFFTYSKGNELNSNSSLYIYNIETKQNHHVTADFFNCGNPTFDREGKYFFFTSNRSFNRPQYEDLGTTWIYSQTEKIYVVTLNVEDPSPFAPLNDEETIEAEKKDEPKDKKDKKDKKKGKDDEKKDEIKKLEIDFTGFTSRAVALPIKAGSFANLAVNNDGHLLFVQRNPSDRSSAVKIFDLKDEKKEVKSVMKSVPGFDISADGKKLLVFTKGNFAIVNAKAKQKVEKMISKKGLESQVNPRNEWKQIFTEAWRFERDFFYDPTMHGVDWNAVYKQYEPMLMDCVSRSDLSYVIREMISEMNVGHAYYRSSPEENSGPRRNVGLLGVEWKLNDGAFQIAEIIQGAPWDEDARGPLSQPGVKISQGDYILAVNGLPLDTAKDPWASFIGLGGKTVTLKVSKDAKGNESRNVVVKLLSSEGNLKYRSWVEKRRKYVNTQTNGQVGYIYVPNTGIQGQNELVRQFYGQVGKEALIIDERWNGGGQIPTRFVELLNRPVANYWALRDGQDAQWPPDSHQGPKCMLINGLAGSGGDYFPFWFKAAGVGKLIGTRTWGGLVGYSGEPSLLDGAGVTVPTFAFYEKDGTWGIEGHGVDPDIEVIDDPASMQDGADPQLDRAIQEMLKEIKEHPYVRPNRPEYPKRDKMGITEADK